MSDWHSEGKIPYFPPLYGEVNCRKCEHYGPCLSCDRFQRDRRDFTITSGRCPRLPDWSGFLDSEQQELYTQFFPLVHVKREGDKLDLMLQLPKEKRRRRVYRKGGYWYFRDHSEGEAVKRALTINEGRDKKEILRQMNIAFSNYCVFRCTVEDYFVF